MALPEGRSRSSIFRLPLSIVLLSQLFVVECKAVSWITPYPAVQLPQPARLELKSRGWLRPPDRSTTNRPDKRSYSSYSVNWAQTYAPEADLYWLSRVRGGSGGGGPGRVGGGGKGGNGGDEHSEGGGHEGGDDNEDGWSAVVGVMGSLWNQYSVLLQDKPLTTKAITAGFIAVVGDCLAQGLEKGWLFERFSDADASKKFDLARSIAVLIDGLVVTGPGLHYLYTALERVIPAQKGFFAAAVHVAVDELIFDPLFVLGFFFLCGAIEGRDMVRDIIPQVKREYWSALKGGWAVSLLFLPIEFSTFRFLPVHLRVLMVNLTDVMWTAVVSYFSHLHVQNSNAHPTPAIPTPMK